MRRPMPALSTAAAVFAIRGVSLGSVPHARIIRCTIVSRDPNGFRHPALAARGGRSTASGEASGDHCHAMFQCRGRSPVAVRGFAGLGSGSGRFLPDRGQFGGHRQRLDRAAERDSDPAEEKKNSK
eukprot:TRINITY_DN19151_c0_g1_i1.p2 TRINITY_DN19151_c0_g1~~TRINITY_DN19151_c0_g1_i1.p2  ORF type:complete len:126 (+),score=12.52 TRINITY_DN19151_c0_g1_i1:205-582(+)